MWLSIGHRGRDEVNILVSMMDGRWDGNRRNALEAVRIFTREYGRNPELIWQGDRNFIPDGELRWRDWFIEQPDLEPEFDYDEPPQEELMTTDRQIKLSPFRMEYETREDAQMRVGHSIIAYKKHPVYIHDVLNGKDGFKARAEDADAKVFELQFDKNVDFRSFEPGYIMMDERPVWMSRTPARIQKQGLGSDNTLLTHVGSRQAIRWEFRGVLQGLRYRKNQKWSNKLEELFSDKIISAARLSNCLAVFRMRPAWTQERKEVGKMCVDYNGRKLGILVDDCVDPFDTDDCIPSWITQDLAAVGLNFK